MERGGASLQTLSRRGAGARWIAGTWRRTLTSRHPWQRGMLHPVSVRKGLSAFAGQSPSPPYAFLAFRSMKPPSISRGSSVFQDAAKASIPAAMPSVTEASSHRRISAFCDRMA